MQKTTFTAAYNRKVLKEHIKYNIYLFYKKSVYNYSWVIVVGKFWCSILFRFSCYDRIFMRNNEK